MILCRNCNRDIHVNSYSGFCSIDCCADFAVKNNITFDEAAEMDFFNEISSLEEKIDKLEGELSDSDCECENYSKEIYELKEEVRRLEKEVKDLKDLDWERIKEERKKEREENFRYMNLNADLVIKNGYLEEEIKKVRKDNKELLEDVKHMMSHSDRFQQIDFGYE